MSDPTTSTETDIPEMDPEDLRTLLAEGRPVSIVDIRPAEEFAEWQIPTSRNWPIYEELSQGDRPDPAGAPEGQDAPVITVCGSGKKSLEAADILREEGREAYSLRGGLQAWTLAWNQAEVPVGGPADVIQVRRTGKGCLSYLIGSAGEAVVIDPSVDPAVYEAIAEDRGWTIAAVADTHIHADHCSRAGALAEQADAELLMPATSRVEYAYLALEDGDTVSVGDAELEVLGTPGHTPESVTYRLSDQALFTGDTLFLESVGRPDLDAGGEEARTKARALYRSVQRLRSLPAELLVLPGHHSRPVPFDNEPLTAPLGAVSEGIGELAPSEEAFAERAVREAPETPPNHETVIGHNRRGQLPDRGELIELEAGANRCALN